EFLKPAPFGGNYQFVVQLKEMPANTDWSKPFYDLAHAPSKGRFPDKFDRLDGEAVDRWEKDGRRVTIEFPDFTILYLPSDLTENDQKYLADLFWNQRWSSWLSLAFGLPVIALLLGLAVKWVIYGFVHSAKRFAPTPRNGHHKFWWRSKPSGGQV